MNKITLEVNTSKLTFLIFRNVCYHRADWSLRRHKSSTLKQATTFLLYGIRQGYLMLDPNEKALEFFTIIFQQKIKLDVCKKD